MAGPGQRHMCLQRDIFSVEHFGPRLAAQKARARAADFVYIWWRHLEKKREFVLKRAATAARAEEKCELS